MKSSKVSSFHRLFWISNLILMSALLAAGSPASPQAKSPMGAPARKFTVRQSEIYPRLVREGENVTFTCMVDGSIAFDAGGCLWNAPHPLPQVVPRLAPPGSGIEPIGDPSSNPLECNFLITAAKAEHHGTWECNPIMINNEGIHANDRIPINLTVAVTPTPPRPEIVRIDEIVDGGQNLNDPLEFEQRNFSCALKATRPGPEFYWYLASSSGAFEEPLEDVEEYQWSVPTADTMMASRYNDLHDYYSNITLTMTSDMNSKSLRCYTDHLMLAGGENSTDFPITVRSAPVMRQCNETHGQPYSVVGNFNCEQRAFNFYGGRSAVIAILFSANPEPTSIQWKIPSKSGVKTLAGNAVDGQYTAHWGPASPSTSDFDAVDPQLGAYWDRGDLYWANLTISKFGSEHESDLYILEISNGVEFDEYDGTNPIPTLRPPSAPAGNNRNGQRGRILLPPGVTSGNSLLRQNGASGVSPRHTVVRQYQFGVRILPGYSEAGMSGGAIAGIVLAVLSVVIIIAIVVFARAKNLLCFQKDYSPGLNSYFRQSLSSWRKPPGAKAEKGYQGVATKPPGDGGSAEHPEHDAADGHTVGSSTTATVSDDGDQPPPRPPKGPNLRDYRNHSQLSEGEDVV